MSDWSGGVDLKPGDEVKLPDGAVKMIGEVYPAVDAQKPKLCINCRWFPGNDPDNRQIKPPRYMDREKPKTCFHEKSLLSICLIDGNENRETCDQMRAGACGAQGSLYEDAIGEWMNLRGHSFMIEFVPFAEKDAWLKKIKDEEEAQRVAARKERVRPYVLPSLPASKDDGAVQTFLKWMRG